ncbi:MAG: DUF2065 domain-containing protein [Pseudomonadota bacterium]
MDFVAALALVLVIEGLALAIFARSVPQVLAEIDQIGPAMLRMLGIVSMIAGGVIYILVRRGGLV